MSPEPRDRTTLLLGKLVDGDSAAAEHLLPVLYDQLRAIARRLLVDQARARHAEKRGSGRRPATLDEALAGDPMDGEQVLMVHDALEVLGCLDAQLG